MHIHWTEVIRRRVAHASGMLRDCLPTLSLSEQRKLRIFAIAAAIPVFGAVAAFGVAPLDPDAAMPAVRRVQTDLQVPTLNQQVIALESASAQYNHEERIRRGATLGTILTRLQVSDPQAEQFIRADASARALYQLRPGRLIQARTDEDGNLVWLRYLHTPADGDQLDQASSHALVIERTASANGAPGTLSARDEAAATERRVELRTGEITSSLFGATDAAGVPEGVATQIATILSGDIDFYRDLRRGDRFRVVYEMSYVSGEVARAGKVLALEFVHAGKTYQAVWYQRGNEPGGYYGFDGQSLRRAFLRAPLEFTRISSGFGGRMHPILNIWKWHTGIDYAAPIGTPVHATADGTVAFVGTQTGYGNAIALQNQGVYSTLYGHLSAFARGLHRGQHVSQGELIGYVGMTGWATGPHLHYEFRIGGVAKDPQHVDMPNALPVPQQEFAAFRTHTSDYTNQIGLLRGIDLASGARSGPGA